MHWHSKGTGVTKVVSSKASLVTQLFLNPEMTKRSILAVLLLDDISQGLVELRPHTQSITERLRPYRKYHELLHGQSVPSMGAPIDHIESLTLHMASDTPRIALAPNLAGRDSDAATRHMGAVASLISISELKSLVDAGGCTAGHGGPEHT
ncbi:hypothetical protein EYF80_035250 [Liparis tanakae]|uniref:Uncharacterized protein n=1 Tax=Liparis tanakae TaxID=230148 RepID=A0A4Z2GLW8_9TELE|nr:hypothetical protein EYF80_035250 [Liparis tanakae]